MTCVKNGCGPASSSAQSISSAQNGVPDRPDNSIRIFRASSSVINPTGISEKMLKNGEDNVLEFS